MAKFIDIHTHHSSTDQSSTQLQSIALQKDVLPIANGDYSLGLHPWYIPDTYDPKIIEILENKIQQNNVKAIGECGLDKLAKTDWQNQVHYFEQQILLSQKYNLPLILHVVKAYEEVLQLLNKNTQSTAVIFMDLEKRKNLLFKS